MLGLRKKRYHGNFFAYQNEGITVTNQITASNRQIQRLIAHQDKAQKHGDVKTVIRTSCLLQYFVGQLKPEIIANHFSKSLKTIIAWIAEFAVLGLNSLKIKLWPGRQAKLTKAQRRELKQMIEGSPQELGFPEGGWNSAMVAQLIFDTWDVEYSVKYIPELLKGLKLSYQKAKFEPSAPDIKARVEWYNKTWPSILKKARKNGTPIFFLDEASFAMWGSLAYTWGRRGTQPIVKTSGKRRNYKVFGAIEYFTGKFLYQGLENGKLNASTYIDFLTHILFKIKGDVILIHDGAPYHKAADVTEFIGENERLDVYRLPPYSPAYNPIELLWRTIKRKGTHLIYFPTFDDLVFKVECTLDYFSKKRDEIAGLFGVYKNHEIS
jgi:transposase